MGSACLYTRLQTCTFLDAFWSGKKATGVAPQPEQGMTAEGPWQDKTGMFAVEALELYAPHSYGSVPPTSGSSCRLRYKSKIRFRLADLHFSKFTMTRQGKNTKIRKKNPQHV